MSLFLEKIHLVHFKNYENLLVDFTEGVNCIVGRNGSGKTNLLDAIHYLCLTKSAFSGSDFDNIKNEEQTATFTGIFKESDTGQTIVQCILDGNNRKKIIKKNKEPYAKLSEHIGRFPVVMIEPDDTDLVRGGSEGRRRFFDTVICQYDADYLVHLMAYNRLLLQRNNLLKQFAERQYADLTLLQAYDHKLLEHGQHIYRTRQQFIENYKPVFENNYQQLTEQAENVAVYYQSDWQQPDFKKLFTDSRHQDLAAQRTLKGIHKDDYEFLTNSMSLKKTGSQGQKKSFVIALKITNFMKLAEQKGIQPIMLLDDIFDKLDQHRINQLVKLVHSSAFGQVFITDARPERSQHIFEANGMAVNIINIEK